VTPEKVAPLVVYLGVGNFGQANYMAVPRKASGAKAEKRASDTGLRLSRCGPISAFRMSGLPLASFRTPNR
jgi:hypothetical protein